METNPNINSSSSSINPSKPEKKLLPSHHSIHIKDEYWKKFPVGYRFCPRDEELIVHYLRKKVSNQALPPNKIAEVNIYNHNPEDLAEFFKAYKEDDVYYFFTSTDRKYPNGDRPRRAASGGYWKATGARKPVNYHGEIVGSRNALVFYSGKPPNGVKTNWIMHEFKVDDKFKAQNPPPTRDVNSMTLDDWVLCKIYHKPGKSCKAQNMEENHQHHDKTHQNKPTTAIASPPSPQLNLPNDGDITGHQLNLPNDGDIVGHDQNQDMNNNNKIMESESKLLPQDDPLWNYYINQENITFGYQESCFGWHMGWIDNANNYSDPFSHLYDSIQ